MEGLSGSNINEIDGSSIDEESRHLAELVDEDDGFQVVGRKERKIKPKAVNQRSSKPISDRNKSNGKFQHMNGKTTSAGAYPKQKEGMKNSSSDGHKLAMKPNLSTSSSHVHQNTAKLAPHSSSADAPRAVPVPIEKLSLEPKPVLSIEAFAAMTQSVDETFLFSSTGYISSRGLENSGNACYRNAVFQVLFANHSFNRYLKQLSHVTLASYELPAELGLFKELLRFVYAVDNPSLNNQRTRPLPSILPDRYFTASISEFSALRRSQESSMASMLATPSQEDAMEFLTFLLDQYHSILSRLIPSTQADTAVDSDTPKEEDEWLTAGKGITMSRVVVDVKSKQDAMKEHASSIISRLFHGILRSEVTYSNKKTSSTTFQQFHVIPLELPVISSSATSSASKHSAAYIKKHSLLTSMDRFFRSEAVDGKKIQQSVLIEELPEILIFQMKRFAFDYANNIPIKVFDEVEYPLRLVLPKKYFSMNLQEKLTTNNVDGDISVCYRLVGVILHHGPAATKGHYTAAVLDSNNQWKHFDDDIVSYLRESEALSFRDEASYQ